MLNDVRPSYSGRQKFVRRVETMEAGLDLFFLGRQVFLDRDKHPRLHLVSQEVQLGTKVIVG